MATAQDGTDSVPLRIATWNCGSALRRGPSVLDELAADVVVLQSVSAGDLDAIDGSLFVGPAGKDLPLCRSTAGPSHHRLKIRNCRACSTAGS